MKNIIAIVGSIALLMAVIYVAMPAPEPVVYCCVEGCEEVAKPGYERCRSHQKKYEKAEAWEIYKKLLAEKKNNPNYCECSYCLGYKAVGSDYCELHKEIYSKSSSSSSKHSSGSSGGSSGYKSYDEGYDSIYDDEDYDWDRYQSDSDYADGVDDAMEESDEW